MKWIDLNYEQKLFRRKIDNLFLNDFDKNEIMKLTAMSEPQFWKELNEFNKKYYPAGNLGNMPNYPIRPTLSGQFKEVGPLASNE